MPLHNTIMISLTSSVAIANFTPEGGVLERLIADVGAGTRFVLLTAPAFAPRLERFQARDSVVFEFVKGKKPRGFCQTFFRFFYSYLIFTGTTRILATFGARADLPPAGGNRHLAPLKFLVANTLGRVPSVKTRLVPWLYEWIFRDRPYRGVIERYRPDLVFVSNLASFPDIEIIAEARRQGVRTLGMVQNWDHLNKYFIPVHADNLLVQNEPMRSEAVTLHAYPPETVSVTGFPQFDVYARWRDFVLPREEFFRRFGIPLERHVILYISGSAYSLDEPDILSEIARWIANGALGDPAVLMVRPYVVARDRAIEEEKYTTLAGVAHVVFNWERFSENEENIRMYISMLHYADVVISVFSTTAIEAAIFDKPTLTIGFDGHTPRPPHESITRLEQMSHFRHVLENGSVRIVRNFDELRRAIVFSMRNPKTGAEERARLVRKMCFRLDGRASERVAHAILDAAAS